ncbi:MAG: radical SAM protein [Bacilli bacterium]|jgi:radical SAM superfamily enzyme YgiQ (UPF0313 family)|nr:radical SAM protein [Bacilli bacterium]
MQYIGNIFRPPSEARSLLVQLTVGCSHNKCTFCSMYKDKQFYVRDINEVINELENFEHKDYIEKIFLCDGDALVVKTDDLIRVLQKIKELFVNVKQISSYATFQDVLRKSDEELKLLKDNGLSLLYLGAESGSDKILKNINKGVTSDEIIEACLKAKACGFDLSIMIIIGIASKALSKEHAMASAQLINKIQPKYFAVLSLMVEPNTPLYQDVINHKFEILDSKEEIMETRMILEHLDLVNTFFSSAHNSNYLFLKGNLNKDKQLLINKIDNYLNNGDFHLKIKHL